MTAGDRFKQWIDDTAREWSGRLGTWAGSFIAGGLTKSSEDLEPGMIDQMREALTKLRDNPHLPPEYRAIIDKSLAEGNIMNVLFGWLYIVLGILPAVLGAGQPIGNLMNYDQERILHSFRLPPDQIIDAWLRSGKLDETLFDELDQQGWDKTRIELLKELSKIIPPLADMVRFADFSAFDPEVISRWREFYDAPGWITEPMSLIGITNEEPRDWANKYWFSHWRQPGRYELGDMYRRGLLGTPLVGSEEVGGPGGEGEAEATIKLAYKTMGYSSFWQDALLQLVREVPTRVDVRRWWDMRTIDEAELTDIYRRQGYFGKDLNNYVLWTKVYVAFPDLLARWSKGWITIEQVRSELVDLGMPADRVEEMIQTKVKAVVPEPVDEAKKVTQTAIIKWVKEDIEARWEEGVDLLMDLGYDEEGARFVLDAYIAEAGSPETYADWKKVTSEYKIAIGREAKPMPEELKQAARELLEHQQDVEELERLVKEEEANIIPVEEIPEEAEKRLTELRTRLFNAQATLQLAQTRYNGLLAEWKQTFAE